jgi:hypothetical protein
VVDQDVEIGWVLLENVLNGIEHVPAVVRVAPAQTAQEPRVALDPTVSAREIP